MRKTRRYLAVAIALLLSAQLWGKNTVITVEQVTETVTLTDDVDYVITSATPFSGDGVIDIQNTEHATLILQGLKPSKAKGLLASRILINGAKAVDGTNCQLKMYNRGSIILPYAKDIKPLTVFSEQNFEGESCDAFGLENTGGYMNTLTEQKLNNRIRSFKLKRGYMVTFSLRPEGRGYSRCFIAANEDLEIASLPAILDRSISSYRVFKWYDAGKPQLAAAAGDNNACGALNVTSTYTWSAGSSMLPDQECVAHQIYSTWPSPSSLGSVNFTCHLKTSNEPRNSSDDHPETLTDILNVWENLMRTGMRLCSPSSWDGSDYWNGTGFLKEFFDSIDARGWRCDIIDMHCYWAESNFNNLKNWVNAVHRPIWISEWCWGASWNTNGAFANGVTNAQVRDALQRICNNLNSMDYVERYFYWNSERDPSRIYKNGALTPAGQMYSQLDGGLSYNGKYDYVPKAPKQQDPKDLQVYFDSETNTVDLIWYEYNHEMNEYIHVECCKGNDQPWEVVRDVTGIEAEGLHILRGLEAQHGWEFRISEKDANSKIRTTKAVMAVNTDMQPGSAVDINGQTWYLGGNIIPNGNFDMGLYGWKNGKGEDLSQPWFQVVPVGGNDGAFLQCYGNGSLTTEQAVRTAFVIQPQTNYYFSGSSRNMSNVMSQITLSEDGQKSNSIIGMLDNSSSGWGTKFVTFNSGDYGYALLAFRTLGSKSSFDNLSLCQLFSTREEAIADGAACERKRAEAIADYIPGFKPILTEQLATSFDDKRQDAEYVKGIIKECVEANNVYPKLTSLWENAKILVDNYPFMGYEQVRSICEEIDQMLLTWGTPSPQWILEKYDALQQAVDEYMPMSVVDDKVKSPSFKSVADWQTKAGTYKDGDQRVESVMLDRTFWNAWWNIAKQGNETQTMAIRQEVTDLSHGLYAIECEAATEHFCLTDQHAYISNGKDSVDSPRLTADYMDLYAKLKAVDANDVWQTLTSRPIYVQEGGSAFIGFQSSKQDANDLAWREIGNTSSKGDHREGWWGATNFRLRFHPLYRITTTPDAFGVICLPYAVAPAPGVTFYQVAAITDDFTKICLREINETEAGVPFIYKSTLAETSFLEYGEATSKAVDAPGNLRGFFKTVAKAPLGYYVLTDGTWKKVTGERPAIGEFTAIMRPMTDKQSEPIPTVRSWPGSTMPIEGVTEEEIAASINNLRSMSNAQRSTFHTLSGQPASDKPTRPGIYIKTENGKTTKTIIK